jgi:DNA-binding transcriptional MerR regulator
MTSAELTIAEVAERTGLTRHTLRSAERDGLMLGVGRVGSGYRRYSERDLGWIDLITKLQRSAHRHLSERSAVSARPRSEIPPLFGAAESCPGRLRLPPQRRLCTRPGQALAHLAARWVRVLACDSPATHSARCESTA